MEKRQHELTLREMHEAAHSKRKDYGKEAYESEEHFDDDDADCFCD